MSQPANPVPGGIDGKTRVVVHLAWPSAHLRTPTFFNPRCRELGLNAVLVPWAVKPERLADAWQGLRHVENLAGVILTLPHKQAAAPLCDALEGDAVDLGVVNVARRDGEGRFTGRMYDGEGMVQGMLRQGVDPAGKRTLLLGAGGAATAIAFSLARAGVSSLSIANRSAGRAQALAARVGARVPGVPVQAAGNDPAGYELVVNATSLGLRPDDPMPCDPARLDPGATVAEVVMQPAETPLLIAARERGARVHKGEHMITAQMDLLIGFLLGEPGGAPQG